jgi:hypothetical protein
MEHQASSVPVEVEVEFEVEVSLAASPEISEHHPSWVSGRSRSVVMVS